MRRALRSADSANAPTCGSVSPLMLCESCPISPTSSRACAASSPTSEASLRRSPTSRSDSPAICGSVLAVSLTLSSESRQAVDSPVPASHRRNRPRQLGGGGLEIRGDFSSDASVAPMRSRFSGVRIALTAAISSRASRTAPSALSLTVSRKEGFQRSSARRRSRPSAAARSRGCRRASARRRYR